LLPPTRESCCVWIDKTNFEPDPWQDEKSPFPARPSVVDFNLKEGYGVSSVEHMPNQYRLYKGDYQGVFKAGELVCSSISKENEWKDFIGIFYFSENEYQRVLRDYQSFWEWQANKNDQRWITQEKKEAKCDYKNLMHTCRLLMEAENIATNGEPVIRFTGEKLQFLKDIRAGKKTYEEVLWWSEIKCAGLDELYENSNLPNQVSGKKVIELYEYLLKL